MGNRRSAWAATCADGQKPMQSFLRRHSPILLGKGSSVKSVSDLGDLSGKRVLIRCDLNVPLDGQTITDDGRIRASLPTLNELRERGAKIIVLAHLGRPKGQVNPKYSLAPAAKRLSELLNAEVKLAQDVLGESAQRLVSSLSDGEVGMLENVRYEPGEESKDEAERGALADRYAVFGDAFVSDGFGVVHRKQASVYDVAKRLPNAAGKLVQTEVEVLSRLVEGPARPYVVVLGGAKISDKLGVVANLIKTADILVIGGGMVFTFLAAQGYEVGKSLLEEDQIGTVRGYLNNAASGGKQIVLPSDIVVAQAPTEVNGLTVVGGGDSAAVILDLGFRDVQFGHISTGGWASLEYL